MDSQRLQLCPRSQRGILSRLAVRGTSIGDRLEATRGGCESARGSSANSHTDLGLNTVDLELYFPEYDS